MTRVRNGDAEKAALMWGERACRTCCSVLVLGGVVSNSERSATMRPSTSSIAVSIGSKMFCHTDKFSTHACRVSRVACRVPCAVWTRHDAYLLLFDDGQATLDEGEGLGRAQNGLPLALVGQITVGLAALRERALEDELVCK